MIGPLRIFVSAIAFAAACSGSAQAANTRTWISGHGVDQAGCGPVASPCRTLQFAHDSTTSGGEIDVLDAAGFGSVVITKGINIVNDGAGVAGVLAAANGAAITINASTSDDIVLKGLSIEGANVGSNGIVFNSGRKLVVSDCLIQNFANFSTAGNGILLQPVSGTPFVTVTGTKMFHNVSSGLLYSPPPGSTAISKISIDHTIVNQNGGGLVFDQRVATSSAAISISASTISGNRGDALNFYEVTGGMQAYVDNSVIHANSRCGLFVSSTRNSIFYVGRSVITSNLNGVVFNVGTLAPVINSYGDNRINGNVSGDVIQGTLTYVGTK